MQLQNKKLSDLESLQSVIHDCLSSIISYVNSTNNNENIATALILASDLKKVYFNIGTYFNHCNIIQSVAILYKKNKTNSDFKYRLVNLAKATFLMCETNYRSSCVRNNDDMISIRRRYDQLIDCLSFED